ncbi:gas vesicle protein GvpFL [Halobacteriales archaeon QS_5_70_15]|nr:MAG: gas vesicle protein GvpFL [Halobacteriales archaeon QS_5_70_15]
MSEQPPVGGAREESDADSPAFDEGRYLYCVVDVTGGTEAAVPETGIEGGEPYLVRQGGLGVVVQACDSPFDSTDVDTVKRWLLRHQSVVDGAGEAFGTPLPFRFDTVLKGDDEQVREWLDEESDALRDALDDLAGRWEYRIEVVRNREALERRLSAEDEELSELRRKRDDASEGTGFLIEKQYEQRLGRLVESALDEEAAALADRLCDVAAEVRPVERTASPLGEGRGANGDEERTSLAVLAAEEREGEIGDVLDEVAARPEVEVRFTGPWPPYSFAPAIGDGGDG